MGDEIENGQKAKPEEMLSDEQKDKTENLEPEPKLIRHETERTNIAYTADFKEVISKNPGLIREFIDSEKQIAQDPSKKSLDGDRMHVEIFYRGYESLNNFYDVQVDGERYFIKVAKRGAMIPGDFYDQIVDAENAKKTLKSHPIPGVKIADYQFGFKKGPKMYFISKWANGERVDRLFETIDQIKDTKERYQYQWVESPKREEKIVELEEKIKQYHGIDEMLKKRIDEVRTLFPTYYDVNPNNFIYDSEKDELTWIDQTDTAMRGKPSQSK